MTTNEKTFPVLARVFSRSCAKRSNSPVTSPPRTTCFDIFSPPPGDSDVISHVDRLSSNETKIAPRSVRIAVGAGERHMPSWLLKQICVFGQHRYLIWITDFSAADAKNNLCGQDASQVTSPLHKIFCDTKSICTEIVAAQ